MMQMGVGGSHIHRTYFLLQRKKPTSGQGLSFALRLDWWCIKGLLISLKKFKKNCQEIQLQINNYKNRRTIVYAIVFMKMSENGIFQVISLVIGTNTLLWRTEQRLAIHLHNSSLWLNAGKLGERSHKRRKQVISRVGVDLIGVQNAIWMSSPGQRVQPPLRSWSHAAWPIATGTELSKSSAPLFSCVTIVHIWRGNDV